MSKKQYTMRVELIKYITVSADNIEEAENNAYYEASKLGDFSGIIVDECAGATVKDIETDEEYEVNEWDERIDY